MVNKVNVFIELTINLFNFTNENYENPKNY
jgi:hypothetical protein